MRIEKLIPLAATLCFVIVVLVLLVPTPRSRNIEAIKKMTIQELSLLTKASPDFIYISDVRKELSKKTLAEQKGLEEQAERERIAKQQAESSWDGLFPSQRTILRTILSDPNCSYSDYVQFEQMFRESNRERILTFVFFFAVAFTVVLVSNGRVWFFWWS